MKIRFNDTDEFIEELSKDQEKIERRIVRVNFLTKPLKSMMNIHSQTLVAQCIIAGHVVTLEKYCGDIWSVGMETNEKTYKKSEELRANLANKLIGLDLEIRGGMIEVPA